MARTGFGFFVLCIFANIVNVIMEEGIFRGLFIRLAELRMTFLAAALLSSTLFGIWHIVAPIRAFLDGEQSAQGTMMSALLLVVTSAVAGFKFALLLKISESLWMPMADHFVNNTVVNLVHVVGSGGVDELQVVRISIAQTLSFVIVLVLFFATKAGGKPTFRETARRHVPSPTE